jgi:hypothetical protein
MFNVKTFLILTLTIYAAYNFVVIGNVVVMTLRVMVDAGSMFSCVSSMYRD